MAGFILLPKRWLGGLLLLALSSIVSAAPAVLILGDSISAAYGVDKAAGWVALLEQRYQAQCPGLEVINASVSGEISAGGRQRLPALLAEHQPQIVVIELGGNDGLRGLSPQSLEQNLRAMVKLSRAAGATPLLLGMYLPPNYGDAYRQLFDAAFSRVADTEQVPLVPFFLDQVGGVDALMQPDGLHPTAAAQPQLLDNALTVLAPALRAHCASAGQ